MISMQITIFSIFFESSFDRIKASIFTTDPDLLFSHNEYSLKFIFT